MDVYKWIKNCFVENKNENVGSIVYGKVARYHFNPNQRHGTTNIILK